MTDANPTNGAAPSRSWFRRPWVLIAAGVLLVVGGVWANHLHERAKGRREIEKRLDVLRAMGVAVTPTELATKYPDPPLEKDARRLLQPGLAELEDPPGLTIPYFDEAIPTNRLTRLSDEQLAEVKSYLDEQSKAFARIPDVSLDGAWFGSGFANWDADDAVLSRREAHRFVKLLHLSALMEIEAGKRSQAVRTILRAQAVNASIRSEMLIKHVGFRVYSDRSIDLVQRLLNRTSVAENELRELMAVFIEERPTGFRTSWEYETVHNVEGMFLARRLSKMSLMSESQSDDPWTWAKDWFEKLYAASKMKGFSDDEFCRILELRAELFEALNLEPAGAVARWREISPDTAPSRSDVANGKVSPVYEIFHPTRGLGSRLARDFEKRAKIRCTRVALAIERYRLAHAGSLPESLANLVPAYLPEVPFDLFDGQPLRYRKLPKGYVVYSIGRDLTDDGGKEPPANPKPDERYDLTFIVERPE